MSEYEKYATYVSMLGNSYIPLLPTLNIGQTLPSLANDYTSNASIFNLSRGESFDHPGNLLIDELGNRAKHLSMLGLTESPAESPMDSHDRSSRNE